VAVRKLHNWHYIVLAAIVIIPASYFLYGLYQNSETVQRQPESVSQANPAQLDPQPALPELTISDDSSVLRLINAEHRLAPEYVPSDLALPDVSLDSRNPESQLRLRADAAQALERMFAAAKEEEDLDLQLASGYRPYSTQEAIYNSAGGENQTLVAVPGGSEHQSGLAADIKREDFVCRLEECFGNQPEGIWSAGNAHRFGYILRYPEGKEDITGISYEAWHFRYVGEELAKILHDENLTLEEYYQRQVQ
jgi:D-alanyl-D-alanine carboxypeptidase